MIQAHGWTITFSAPRTGAGPPPIDRLLAALGDDVGSAELAGQLGASTGAEEAAVDALGLRAVLAERQQPSE